MPCMKTLVKRKKFRSLAVTLVIIFLVLSMSVLSVYSLITIYYQIMIQQENIGSQQKIVAYDATNKVSSFIENKFEILEYAIEFSKLSTGSIEEKSTLLNVLLGSEKSFRRILLMDRNGQNLLKVSRASGLSEYEITEQHKKEIISQVSQGKTYASDIYIDQTSAEPLIMIAVPNKNVFGDFKNIIIAEVNLKFMWDLMNDIKIGKSGLVYVVDDDGNLIAFGDISRVLSGENEKPLAIIGDFIENKGATGSISRYWIKGINGNDVISTLVPLGFPSWAVIVELPISEAYQPLFQEMTFMASIFLISFVMILVSGSYISKRITEPLIKLRDAAEEIKNGNLDKKIYIKTKDEIGDLSRVFNMMTRELKKSKENLEDIVKKRTIQLDVKIKEINNSRLAAINMLEDVEETRIKLDATYKELKKLDKLKAEFMNMAAHELKTPLIPIIGYLDMVINGEMGRITKKEKDSLIIAFRSAQRLQRLVADILDISKLETNNMKFYFDDVNMEAVLNNLVDSMKPFANEKKISFKSNISKGLPIVYGDMSRLLEVFENLLSNAIKFTKAGEVVISAQADKSIINVTVKDTGPGMSREFLTKKLFGKFQQEDSDERRKYGGTGLGMAISKEIVQKHKGKIWAESVVGKGSTFHVTLPARK
ncbi:MAG: sensor histidine kinase [Candidatus Aenigmatarchaeota archaeon]